MKPSLCDVIDFIREETGCRNDFIDENTRIEHDLGVSGDDGEYFLEAAQKFFGVSLDTEELSFRSLFGLQDNEYLFHSEGLDLLGINCLIDWLRGIKPPVIVDLTVGQFHQALIRVSEHNLAK
ncbi:hypothetical protein M2403_003312 [Rahnella sp. BIGb0603]|uniref:hypothetical protein n=1 Tax=Rahnella sp. BIGb0603 TaxID=2940612 RepID=UPI002169C7E8|nr:hypothetical protein [Rahnella sp. BIGb0603]MCS3424689.1 hypothetical protein [Rahnella sp. BIGb0603]